MTAAPEQVGLVVIAAPAAPSRSGRPTRPAAPSAAPLVPKQRRVAARAPRTPRRRRCRRGRRRAARRTARGGARAARRRPRSPRPPANCAQPFPLRNGAVTNRHGSPSSAASATSRVGDERQRDVHAEGQRDEQDRRPRARVRVALDADAGDLVRPQAAQARRRGRSVLLPAQPTTRRAGCARHAPVALDLRSPLAQPRPAVRALGDVGADLRPAALADDEEVRVGRSTSILGGTGTRLGRVLPPGRQLGDRRLDDLAHELA